MVIMPTQDNVIIKLPKVEKEKVTQSGIVLTGTSVQQEMPEKGTVIAVGEGRILNNGTLIEMKIKEGDEVIFNRFAGTRIQAEDGEFLIVKENDILAVVKQ